MQIGKVDHADLEHLRRSEPTYDHVESTLAPAIDPTGNRYERQATLGQGPAAFTAARTAVRTWRPQRSIGASITPHDVAPDLGETMILGIGVGSLRLTVPNRIVAVVDEPARYGYAYGTLPGHPEQGEELFLLEIHDDGMVTFTIRVDARPRPGLGHLGFAIRPLQRIALRRYLAAVAGAPGRAGHSDNGGVTPTS